MNYSTHLTFALITLVSIMWASNSRALDLSSYQNPDGAITVHPYGDHVDPYFAMKALWAARQLGDPSIPETKAWIRWLLPRQSLDGKFARYCQRSSVWKTCEEPDADDSLLAMWIELLYEATPHRMPSSWIRSADKAKQALDTLRDPTNGVYRIGPNTNEALLMDNVEIYEALQRVGNIKKLAGDHTGAKRYLNQARDLRIAMSKVFRPDEAGLLHWSSTDGSTGTFYPHAVTHLYPWLHKMDTRGFSKMADWDEWLNRYSERWLTRSDDSYPWGLVAVVALHKRSYSFVKRWIANSTAIRGGDNWNVLEETVLQGLARARLERSWG